MPLTSLLWLGLFTGSIVAAALANPMYAALGYLLEYYQRPDLHWWGRSLPDLRWNFTISIVLAATFFLRRSSLAEVKAIANPAFVLLVAQGLNAVGVSALLAVTPGLSWAWAWQYWKNVIIYGLLIGVIRTPLALDLFIGAHMVGAAWWGYDALDQRRIGSRLEGLGSGDTQGSNPLAAHLLTVIPLIVVWIATEKDWRKRLVALASLPLVLNMLILCNSRGATLGFAVAGAVAIVLVRKGKRLKVLGAAIVCAVAVLFLADPEFLTRQATIADAEDNSAQSRFTLWAGGVEMIKDYPLGLGGRGYHAMSPRYATNTEALKGKERSSHNTYIQVATDWGIQGFLLFLGFLFFTFRALHRVRAREDVSDWFFYRSLAIEVGLIGTLVAGFFSARFYGESIYWLCALAIALERMQAEPAVVATSPQSPAQVVGGTEAIRARA